MFRAWQRLAQSALRVMPPALAIALLCWTFRDTQPQRVAALLGRLGPAALLLLIPQLAALALESAGWRLAFRRMGRGLPFIGLLRTRLATEAVAQSLPCGVLLGESLKPFLLSRSCGSDLATNLAGLVARKWLLLASHGLYVGGFALLGWGMLAHVSRVVLGGTGLPYLAMAVALALLLAALAAFVLFSKGCVAARLQRLLLRVPLPWLRETLERCRDKLAQTDGRLEKFFSGVLASPLPLLVFLGAWLLEAGETLLILRLLDVELAWTSVGALEACVGFLRSLAFMLPAGLGVQDLGYVAFFRALDVPDALNVAAAFLVLKRGKECLFAGLGYLILATLVQPARPPTRKLQRQMAI